MPAINFYTEPPAKYKWAYSKLLIKKWLKIVAQQEQQTIENLTFILCTDEYLLQLNQQYLKHNTYTDVITFDNADPIQKKQNKIEGDIFISIERISENAQKFNQPTEKELLRVIVHGTLHLLGYTDKKNTQKQIMTQKENLYLTLFDNILLSQKNNNPPTP